MVKVKDWVDKWKKDVGVIRSINDQPVILQGESGEELFFGHFLEVPTKYYEYSVEEHSFHTPTFSWEERLKGSITAYASRDFAHILRIKEAEGDIETENRSEEWSQTEAYEDLAAMAKKVAFQDIVMPDEVSIHSSEQVSGFDQEDVSKMFMNCERIIDFGKAAEVKHKAWFDDEDTSDSDEDYEDDKKSGGIGIWSTIKTLLFLLLLGAGFFLSMKDFKEVKDEYRISDAVIVKEVEYNELFDDCQGVAEYEGQEFGFSSDKEHYDYLCEHIGKEVEGEIETTEYDDGTLKYTAVWFWYEL